MDNKVFELYLKPDIKEGVNYSFLFNPENSYRTFVKNLKSIFNRRIYIANTKPDVAIYMIMSDVSISLEDNFIISMFKGTNYELQLTLKITLVEEHTMSDGSIKTIEVNIKRQTDMQKITIPAYVCYKGESPIGNTDMIQSYTHGGFFVVNKGMKKYITNRRDLPNTNPKYKKKDKNYRIAFNSIPLRFQLHKTKQQYLAVELAVSDKIKFDIVANKTFINTNIIILVYYLLQIPFDDLENIIMMPFSDEIRQRAKFVFIKSKYILDEYPGTTNDKVSQYLYARLEEYSNKKGVQELRDIFTSLLKSFLPHLDETREKGIFLISLIRQIIMIVFQNEIYPSKDHLIGKRISPVGQIFEDIVIEKINSFVNEFRENIRKKDKKVGNIFTNLNFEQKMSGMFNSLFTMKDNNNKKIVKPSTNLYEYTDIHFPNAVAQGGGIVLTKNLNARNTELSSIIFEDVMDTPDNPENVGLLKRTAIGTRITYTTYDEQKLVYENLRKFILERSKTPLNLRNNPIICSIVDNSEFPISFINEEECETIIRDLKHYKKHNFENFRHVGIERTPVYVFDTTLQHYVPNGKCFQLRLNIGCKRYYKPFFVVKDGKCLLEDIPEKELDKLKEFSDLTEKYPEVIEYLDPAQLTYSMLCQDLQTFKALPMEERKKYDYVNFPVSSNMGIVAASTYDVGRMAGARGTFAAAQQKQVITQITPDAYNRYESGNSLLNPYERSCITNDVIEHSGVAQLGKGQHILVLFGSYVDNIEDSLVFRKSSVDRGFLDAVTINSFKSMILSSQFNVSTPKKTNNNYSRLEDNGLPGIGTILTKDDAIHKKVDVMYRKVGNNEVDYTYDTSESYNNTIPGRVERTEKSGTDNININILTSSYKPVRIGDKIVNQGAQKGTVGIFLEDEDLPRTKDGKIPDVIINSTSIVSRQTFALLIQSLLTKYFGNFPLDDEGNVRYISYPSFTNINIKDVVRMIEKDFEKKYPDLPRRGGDYAGELDSALASSSEDFGIMPSSEDFGIKTSSGELDSTHWLGGDSHSAFGGDGEGIFIPTLDLEDKIFSNEVMYNKYGVPYREKMMLCPLMYCRSNQIAIDKLAVRNGGKLNKLGIPVSGRKRNGGQRNGEMEMDNLVAHGVSNILFEHTSDVVSNNVWTYFCDNCETPATKESINGKDRWFCIPCENKNLITTISSRNYTQAFKLFKELLRCRGIDMRIHNVPSKVLYPIDENN